MKRPKKTKDEEKAPNQSAKRALTFNELIEANQDANEAAPTCLKRISDIQSELEQAGQTCVCYALISITI